MNESDCAKARKANKTCVLTIEQEDIKGGVPTHTESSVNVITFIEHNSLIRIRRDFIPEILKTAEDL